jgi:tRNA nucleotidyltransferase (CCA-adding enzyme)
MATTIKEAFKTFKSRLEITDLQAETVATRHQNVRDAVAREMTVVDHFLTGSYRRHTMIAPLKEADIDVFIVLDPEYYEKGGQAALLDKVKRVLKRTYPKTPEISRDGQAITITFTDLQVDVVPGFNRRGGGYLIPNSQGGTWIATDPKEHERLSSEQNQAGGRATVSGEGL